MRPWAVLWYGWISRPADFVSYLSAHQHLGSLANRRGRSPPTRRALIPAEHAQNRISSRPSSGSGAAALASRDAPCSSDRPAVLARDPQYTALKPLGV